MILIKITMVILPFFYGIEVQTILKTLKCHYCQRSKKKKKEFPCKGNAKYTFFHTNSHKQIVQ